MFDVTRGSQGELVIDIRGTFDAEAATWLSGWLTEVPADESLVVDFSRTRDCQDFGLAAVASDLAARTELSVLGLNRHQERMLRYFGVEIGAVESSPVGAVG